MICANCPKETTDPANCYEDEGFLRIDGIGEWVCSEVCEAVALAATNNGETDMSKSKYQTSQAEDLYSHTPDEEAGSSSCGNGWIGLYRAAGDGGHTILLEETDGSVLIFKGITEAVWEEQAKAYNDLMWDQDLWGE